MLFVRLSVLNAHQSLVCADIRAHQSLVCAGVRSHQSLVCAVAHAHQSLVVRLSGLISLCAIFLEFLPYFTVKNFLPY